MNIKAIVKFACLTEDSVSSGWSEILYRVEDSLSDAMIWANQLAIFRAALLPVTSRVVSVTVGDLANPRVTQTLALNMSGAGNYRTDTPWQSALLTCSGSLGGVRTYSIRNVPDSVITGGALSNDPVANTWKSALEDFRTHLIARNWCIRIRSKSAAQGDIVAITSAGRLSVLNGAFPVAVGVKIAITRAHTGQGIPISGIFTAVERFVDTQENRIVPWRTGDVVEANGKAQIVAYDMSNIVTNPFSRIGTHKVGRPFGGLRGRRSKRKRVPA